jgi:hypothetical protein
LGLALLPQSLQGQLPCEKDCSAFDVGLGWPTFICSSVTSAAILAFNRQSPWPILRNSWEYCRSWLGSSCWSKDPAAPECPDFAKD